MDFETFTTNIIDELGKININVGEKQIKSLYIYMNMLIEWNKKMNLTGIIDPKEIIQKHFVDSLTVLKYIDKGSKVLDLGTGAGFPGVPLRIIEPSIKLTLLDSINKKIIFLDAVLRELNIKEVEVIQERAEHIGQNKNYRETFDIVVSRAVAKTNVLVEYMLPFAKKNGRCILMKGPNINDELKDAKGAIKELGGEIEKQENLYLSNGENERNIIIIKKTNQTPDNYPRKVGIVQKKPIKVVPHETNS